MESNKFNLNNPLSVRLKIIHLPLDQSRMKPWHKDVKSDLRNHLIKKLAVAIYPNISTAEIEDLQLAKFLNYVKESEKQMFEEADSLDHYYHKLAEKIFRIHKELDRSAAAYKKKRVSKAEEAED